MLADLRYAVRTSLRAPGFAISAIAALALRIGANTAVFSVVYAVLLKPLPYAEPDRLVRLTESSPEDHVEHGAVSAGTFVDWRARSRTLESLAVCSSFFNGETVWDLGGRAQIVKTTGVSPDLLKVLRVQPILGHTFRAESETPPAGALGQFLISYGLWRRAFGGAADIVGRRVMLEGRLPREIIGVLPRGFDFPDGSDAWTSVPLTTVPEGARRARSFDAIARLAPGVRVSDVRRELAGISARLAAEHPASNAAWTSGVEPLAASNAGSARLALLALLGAVGGVLLIGCANVANLLLARATTRRAELHVRVALGASPWRLVRQAFAEAVLLGIAGAVAGIALGAVLARVLARVAPPEIAPSHGVALDLAVLSFAVAIALLSVALVGVAPALQAVRRARRDGLRPDLRGAIRQGAGLRRVVVAGEAAAAVVLLTGAWLFLRTFVNLREVDLGFETSRAVVVETRWPVGHLLQAAPGTRPWPRVQRAVDGLIAAVQSVPGVEAAGLVSEVPLTSDPFSGTVRPADIPGARAPTLSDARDRWRADLAVVTAGYFTALNVPILRGRNFTDADRFSDQVLNDPAPSLVGSAIVNAAFASRYFPGVDPIGREIVLDDARAFGAVRTIVGVVADVRQRAPSEAPRPAVFLPHGQHPDVIRPSIVLRMPLPFGSVAPVIRERLAAFDPKLVVLRVRPMDDVVSGALARPRFNLLLVGGFAALGLLLAAIGIYGVVAALAGERTHEIGIRMALGARAGDVLRLVMRDGMGPVLVGAAAGIGAAAIVTRTLGALLYGVTPLDPVSFVIAPAVLAVVALSACYFPARRAAAVDPLVALRGE